MAFLPRRAYSNVNIKTFFEDDSRVFTYAEIFAILADLDPDLSLALHNVTRLVSSDWTLKVTKAAQSDTVDRPPSSGPKTS
jgi:hypothetical protein